MRRWRLRFHAALTGAVTLGARHGRFDANGFAEDGFEPHSVPSAVGGALILWVGWYGFNPGSTGAMSSESDALVSARAGD